VTKLRKFKDVRRVIEPQGFCSEVDGELRQQQQTLQHAFLFFVAHHQSIL